MGSISQLLQGRPRCLCILGGDTRRGCTVKYVPPHESTLVRYSRPDAEWLAASRATFASQRTTLQVEPFARGVTRTTGLPQQLQTLSLPWSGPRVSDSWCRFMRANCVFKRTAQPMLLQRRSGPRLLNTVRVDCPKPFSGLCSRCRVASWPRDCGGSSAGAAAARPGAPPAGRQARRRPGPGARPRKAAGGPHKRAAAA